MLPIPLCLSWNAEFGTRNDDDKQLVKFRVPSPLVSFSFISRVAIPTSLDSHQQQLPRLSLRHACLHSEPMPSPLLQTNVSPGTPRRRGFFVGKEYDFLITVRISAVQDAPNCASAPYHNPASRSPGKCPLKKGSLMLTCLIPTILCRPSSMILSRACNGSRCARASDAIDRGRFP